MTTDPNETDVLIFDPQMAQMARRSILICVESASSAD
jgi:hypothetical protein